MRSLSLVRSVSLFTLAVAALGCDVGSQSDSDDGKNPDDGKSDASSAPFFLPTGEPDNTAAPAIEVDAKGRVHAVFPAYAGGRAYYATCAADCQGTDDVAVVRFDTDSTVANAMLALDGESRPRVLLSTFNKVYFASCDEGCSDPAGWSQTELLDHRGDREVTGEAFALDPNGNPRFMMHTYVAYLGIGQKAPETYYVACDGACEDAASWSQYKVADQISHRTTPPRSLSVSIFLARASPPPGPSRWTGQRGPVRTPARPPRSKRSSSTYRRPRPEAPLKP
jgi:hypothetical protein